MDATVLLLLLFPTASPPIDPNTGAAVTRCPERIDLLLQNLSKGHIKVMIPTPVLGELLVKAGPQKAKIISDISSSSAFQVQPFDQLAAIELAEILDGNSGSVKPLTPTETKAKVKFDRQIIAIAKVAQVKTIYTDDGGLRNTAEKNGIVCVSTHELPLPPEPPQRTLNLIVGPDNPPDQGTW
ncbi:hypothetical protein [Dokdonella immobilis]|uniref:hypothetical protein n=1 Tax=Dokdonella immobilis TaxID=578942 RepID=UPI001113699B|nr:hypothetical protein [Dokdonella immobilis]